MAITGQAYEVLGNEDSRTRYDQFGHAGVDPNGGAGPGGDPFAGFGVRETSRYIPLYPIPSD